jgi:PleD family two-component response regulator
MLVPRDLACAAPFYHHLQVGPDDAVSELQPIQRAPRILVVDDNDDNRYTLTLYLELEGYTNLGSELVEGGALRASF